MINFSECDIGDVFLSYKPFFFFFAGLCFFFFFQITIVANDFGNPVLSGVALFTVNVLRNKEIPFFPLGSYAATIPQTLVENSFVLEVKATDLDDQVRPSACFILMNLLFSGTNE